MKREKTYWAQDKYDQKQRKKKKKSSNFELKTKEHVQNCQQNL